MNLSRKLVQNEGFRGGAGESIRTQQTSNSLFPGGIQLSNRSLTNPERPNSPNALTMSNAMWCVGFFGSVNFGVSQGNRGEQWD